jgi:acetyl-CoA carboxylase biotin carboxylase subunit
MLVPWSSFFDSEGKYYFLEMNTRLQVEHPVTEMITGLDLVELQLKIAAGEELGIEQKDIKQSGHAIEARLYAEGPQTYMPSPGVITKLQLPKGQVRLDLAVEQDSRVGVFYDPMIGKVIVHGEDRAEAVRKLQYALAEIKISGLTCNLSLLKAICRNEQFRQGNYNTQLLDELHNDIYLQDFNSGGDTI